MTNVKKALNSDWEKAGLVVDFKSRKFRNSEHLHGLHPGRIEYDMPLTKFFSGSTYEGSRNALGFSGFGRYRYPHGPIYEGNFRDGEFHGEGKITYSAGHVLNGLWESGKLVGHKFTFKDGLEFKTKSNYCQELDRRFQIELNDGMRGPNHEILTNRQPTIKIPEGCYDTIDGFYHPKIKSVFKYDEQAIAKNSSKHRQDIDALLRMVMPDEADTIEKKYRAAKSTSVGYKPELYKQWTTGSKKDIKSTDPEEEDNDDWSDTNLSESYLKY